MIKRIAIDLDNTVADFMAGAIPKMEEVFGLKVQDTSKINRIEEAFGLKPKIGSKWDKLGVDKDDYEKVLKIRQTLYVQGRLFRDLPLIENDSWLLTKHLFEEGYKVYFMTARTPHPVIIEDTWGWLEKHGFFFDDVFFTDFKGNLCQALDIPTIVEDERWQILACLEKGVNVIAMAQDWNGELPLTEEHRGKFHRVKSWREMPTLIKEMEY